ncbi:expressed unknown protein [Seminavis robusta]|uniref:Uncharacterized protein n=1 Tax=Seminavis robusta TaxID=568900 RepID=A0A9N8D8E8_9STRA|nr:expressed unknown protein [Seminavis robusta]|eukprot:Sro39_g024260.1 n/a (599) ;mRNA; f:121594-123390
MDIIFESGVDVDTLRWIVILILPGLLLLPLCRLATRWSRKRSSSNSQDESFRIQKAPNKAKAEEVDWILPFQKLDNLPKGEYPRSANGDEISVKILPHESVYGTMHLSLSSYYSRVYRLQQCTTADIDTLKVALSRALGLYPVIAGRCRPGMGRRNCSVVLPVDCLITGEEETSSVCSKTLGSESDVEAIKYGVPFRVYHLEDENATDKCPLDKPLTPMDTATYTVYEDPQQVMNGKAPICTICLYLFPDKSATLSITVSHAVMDGVSIANFEQVWAEESRKLFEMDPPEGEAKQDPTAWVPHHQPLAHVPPVNRDAIPGPFTKMEDYRAAQMEFFGKVVDDGPTLDGTIFQQCLGWLLIEFLLPFLRFFDDLIYLWGWHPDQRRNAVSISARKIKDLKQQLAPPKESGDWIASQDTIVAMLVQKLVEHLQDTGRYRKKKLRVVLFRDARPYVGIMPNHTYGLGVLNWPITIDNPADKSASELAVIIRKGLLDMHNDKKALRFWRLTTTVFEKRHWAFLPFVHKGLEAEDECDGRIMINNSMFPLPNFGGDMGQALSLTTQAGPSIMLPQADGGCRLFIEKELEHVLTEAKLQEAFGE